MFSARLREGSAFSHRSKFELCNRAAIQVFSACWFEEPTPKPPGWVKGANAALTTLVTDVLDELRATVLRAQSGLLTRFNINQVVAAMNAMCFRSVRMSCNFYLTPVVGLCPEFPNGLGAFAITAHAGTCTDTQRTRSIDVR